MRSEYLVCMPLGPQSIITDNIQVLTSTYTCLIHTINHLVYSMNPPVQKLGFFECPFPSIPERVECPILTESGFVNKKHDSDHIALIFMFSKILGPHGVLSKKVHTIISVNKTILMKTNFGLFGSIFAVLFQKVTVFLSELQCVLCYERPAVNIRYRSSVVMAARRQPCSCPRLPSHIVLNQFHTLYSSRNFLILFQQIIPVNFIALLSVFSNSIFRIIGQAWIPVNNAVLSLSNYIF